MNLVVNFLILYSLHVGRIYLGVVLTDIFRGPFDPPGVIPSELLGPTQYGTEATGYVYCNYLFVVSKDS